MRYDRYDYAAIYTEDMLVTRDIKCLQKTKTIKAGQMLEIDAFPSFMDRKDYSRAKKHKPSRKEQQNLNAKNAIKNFIRKMNANFITKDLWATFGWDFERMPASEEEAYRESENFIARINYHRKRAGLPNMKYMYEVAAVDGKEGEPEAKYHIHIVMDGLFSRDKIEELWKGGEYPQTRRLRLRDFGGLTGLALYISKNKNGRQRWRQSRGLKPYTQKPTESYNRFSKSKVKKMLEMLMAGESLKETFEREYPGYAYSDEYPCEIKGSNFIGGYYLYCRMYKKEFDKSG